MTHINQIDVKSDRSDVKVLLIFENTTQRNVAVYWVDYSSKLVHYKTLLPGDKLMVNTYETHPWVFCDKFTGERMAVNHEDVYWPKLRNMRISHRHRTVNRAVARIHFPLRTLRTDSLWTVGKMVSNQLQIDNLEIPKSLKCELTNLFTTLQRHRQNINPTPIDEN